jgi:hypothetical protein
MMSQRSPRLLPALASVLAVGLMLTAAGCSHLAPLGPTADVPQPQHLRSPIVLQAMSVRFPSPTGSCPAGFAKLSAPGQSPACYRPLGAPVTITSAAVAPGPEAGPASPANAPPSQYGLLIFLPPAGQAEFTAVTTQAYDSQGAVDVSVAGKTWGLPMAQAPITHGQFMLMLPTESDLQQLQHMLAPRG